MSIVCHSCLRHHVIRQKSIVPDILNQYLQEFSALLKFKDTSKIDQRFRFIQYCGVIAHQRRRSIRFFLTFVVLACSIPALS